MAYIHFDVGLEQSTWEALREYAREQADAGYRLNDVINELLDLALDIQESRAQDRDTERRLMETES